MEPSGSCSSSLAGTSGRSVALEIDLNETPLPSPREYVAGGSGGGFAAESRCGSCGEKEGAMVVCLDCARRFHVECLGVREEQRGWKCFECLIECRSGKRRRDGAAAAGGGGGGSGLIDMNASPPREADCFEEGYFVHSEQILAARFPKMQDLMPNPFLGFALNSSIATGSSSQNTACSTPRFAHIETETQRGNLIYLQTLKDYISEKQGFLGDGWRVNFEYSETNCKTYAIYLAPDGTRFDSMSKVAQHLGLIPPYNSIETEDKGNNVISPQKGLHSSRRKKEKKANNLREHKNTLHNSRSSIEIDSFLNGSKLFHDSLPVQFEDFFVMSVGKIDPRASFHSTSQIWPVGYQSLWHDKFTGSVFTYDILDGGDSGPVFKVHRYPCIHQKIPYASKVLCMTKRQPIRNDYNNDDFDDDANIQIMFADHSPPPYLDNDTISCLTAEPVINLEEPQTVTINHDVIGEFSVDDVSLSSAWKKAVEAVLDSCHEAYNKEKVLTFCCKHRVEEQYLDASYSSDSLGKFCYLTGPINSIPDKILSVKELEASCEVLRKWLEFDRFGLDSEFVQELIEQLPGVSTCSKYKSLTERSQNLRSKTVGSGFFMAISKDGLQNETMSNSLSQTNKRPSPPGNKVASNLPPHLIGDVIQAYEICLRFYNVLGLEAPISRQIMENELMNPWVDDVKPVKRSSLDVTGDDSVEEHERGSTRSAAASKCAGVELAKFHMALLKVLIEDVLAKVKDIFDPFGGVESKSRKGRKKDAEVVTGSKKINLDMFPVNEFTWPEVARRYILGLLSVDGNLESSEVMTRECGKVFHCLHGDGGTLCGSLMGVAAMEADATVLAEASKRIFSSVNSKAVDFIVDQKESDTGDSAKETNVLDDDSPEWAQALEPVRKLPTNVGARIRRCVYDSLGKNPPDWAKKLLEHSISKEVYKGNASGPTKKLVVSVLDKVRSDIPQPKPTEKKEKEKSGARTISDAVMKQCRVVLRSVAAADEDRVFFNLLAKPVLKPNDPDDTGVLGYPAMVSRPLDFRTIDLRLAAGFYVTSHESFIEDVREVWQNLRIAYRDRSDYLELVETLSMKFEELYEEEVLNLVSRIGNCADSSTEDEKKELNALVIEIIEGPLPPAPWEDGVCKVCGMDKDDDSVLLCDKCDSEYHTYCLDPPLARIPDGNWYCPSCMSSQPISQDERCGTRALSRVRGNRKFRKEFTRNLLENLAPLADTMELMEYWELGIEERVFLFKLLCDEALSSGVVRSHLCPDSGDLEKTLRKLNKELKSQNKKVTSNLPKDVEDKCQEEEYMSFSKSGDGQSQTQKEDDENKHAGQNQDQDQDQESLSEVKSTISSLQEKISTLESKIAKPVIRREFLGRDLVGRVYWAFCSPERVLVLGPNRKKACETAEMYASDDSLWTCYQSDSEIQELIGWLRDDDAKEKDLKDNIIHWRANRVNDDNTPQIVEGNSSSSSGYDTKAWVKLEKKFGSVLKKHGRKGKTINNWYRCDCLELAGSTRHHCSSCHLTFLTYEELEGHNDGKCGNHQETEQPRKKTPLVKHIDLTDRHDEPKPGREPESDSPFVFEEIRAKFCTRDSLKELAKDIGLIGSNGIPEFIWSNPHDWSTSSQPPEKQATNDTLSKVERVRPKSISGKSSLKTRSPVRICQSSLKPLTGRVLEILRLLKINLFDMETALPKEALRPSRGGVDRLRAWRAFVKSAQSIYEMVQATVIFEDMIKTEYLRKEWWFWSSPATAAKISNISALALRIYALDSAIYYEKPATSTVDHTEPVTPKTSRSERKTSEKSNTKDSSEKSTPKNNSPVIDSKPSSEASRPKTRSKKKTRDSDS